MSLLYRAIVERFRLANFTAAVAVLFGLWAAYNMGNEAMLGTIVGGGAVWLWKTWEERKAEA